MSEANRKHTDDAAMRWLPYQRYILKSGLSLQQVKEKQDQTGVEPGDDYAVSCAANSIHIKEASNFKFGSHSRSFKPEATLVEVADDDAHLYRVTIKPAIGAMLLLCLAVLVIIAAIVFSKRNDLRVGNYKDPLIACTCVLLVAYFLPVITFNAELSKLKLFIDDLLEADPEN